MLGHIVTLPPAKHEGSSFLILTNTCFPSSWSQLPVRRYFPVALTCISLMTNDAEHLSWGSTSWHISIFPFLLTPPKSCPHNFKWKWWLHSLNTGLSPSHLHVYVVLTLIIPNSAFPSLHTDVKINGIWKANLRVTELIALRVTRVLSRLRPVWLCDPVDCGPPGSSVHGIVSRQEY